MKEDIAGWMGLVFGLIIGVLFFMYGDFIQHFLVSKEAIIFGRSAFLKVIITFILILGFLILALIISKTFNRDLVIYIIIFTGVIFFLTSFYYYVTPTGVCRKWVLMGNFTPWQRVQEIQLKIYHNNKGGRVLEYLVIPNEGPTTNINHGRPFGELNEVDVILEKHNLKFNVRGLKEDYEANYYRLRPYERKIIERHINK